MDLISQLKQQREEYLKSSENELVKLSLEIASRVVRQKIEKDDKMILRNVRQALKCLLDKGRIVLRLNPADFEIVSKNCEELRSTEGLKELILEEDNQVTRGGCLIHSELAHIDARVETQLESIGKALLNARQT